MVALFSTGAHVLPLADKENDATSAFTGLYSPNFHFFVNIQKYMTRKSRSSFLIITLLAIIVFAVCSLHLSRNALSSNSSIFLLNTPEFPPITRLMVFPDGNINHLVSDSDVDHVDQRSRHVSSVICSKVDDSIAVLMPDWEILVIVSPEVSLSTLDYGKECVCLFQNNATSPATFSGVLPPTGRATFRCEVPKSVKRIRPFFQPILIGKTLQKEPLPLYPSQAVELYRWSFLTYESYSTPDDVVLFVKGINIRQGMNRPPNEFRCVFDAGTHGPVKTTVTTSVQEVFRCEHPNITGFGSLRAGKSMKISLELVNENLLVPSVAYYTGTGTQGRNLAKPEQKRLVCACTMVYNVAKFLKEWVMYHAKIGVDKFILYDNNSDDNLASVVKELIDQGYDVSTVFWIWPKTQEAGFSHSALYAKDMCTWMMYLDVDEFVFSPTWKDIKQPSKTMLPSLLPATREMSDSDQPSSEGAIGQVSFKCHDFGPSGQIAHPVEGVIQGYTCRMRFEQRHKSIVMLEAVDRSLSNVIHHFEVDQERFTTKQVSKYVAVVNHYKYQAWAEFRNKFRRRVSAYVADWTKAVNPTSKDRTPGLGLKAVEPKGWADKFCDVRDDRLKLLTANWF